MRSETGPGPATSGAAAGGVTFQLPDPALEQYTWVLWDEHGPSSRPPLLLDEGPIPGHDASPLPRSLVIHGFVYMRAGAGFPGVGGFFGGPPTLPRSVADLRRWRQEWLPQVDRAVAALQGFDPAAVPPGRWRETLAAQRAEEMRIFAGVHRDALFAAHFAADRFRRAYVARFGPDREGEVEELLHGVPNASTERAAMMWDLSRVLRAAPELLAALDHGRELPPTPAAVAFRRGLEELLERFGATSNADLQDLPTWREDPSIPLAVVRAYARQPDDKGPRAAMERQRQRRLELEAQLRDLARSDAAVAALLPWLEMAQEFIPNLEDHNYYSDQRMAAASRVRWLAIGRYLCERGLLGAADDVFYLEREELIAALEEGVAPSGETLAARRRELQQARQMLPPPYLGRPPGDIAAGSRPASAGGRGGRTVLRGYGASPGSYRGRARVIETLAEAASLVEGDVLVCRTTSPPWTPYFGVIAALVTNSGGPLAHGAVVAREFGIPAVVGTFTATLQIPDGATVTVDGTNGLVIVED